EKAMEILSGLDWVARVEQRDHRLVVEAPVERAADLSRALAEGQVYLSELRRRESSLEEFFLEVTGEERSQT
ncbi:MAG TPA: ABC transporter ATP-binding protein, partial [Dehalococcoidia bacterium]|nr:ABC transporter ATP-binding protein [Dehalococcoidia bacterium]